MKNVYILNMFLVKKMFAYKYMFLVNQTNCTQIQYTYGSSVQHTDHRILGEEDGGERGGLRWSR